ncbi:MAG: dockerin type I domain-containing protein [Planctomycetaceae bacterium]|nr:dockerin type I domain-containing protein [Planctomycetaceae bacterium]
MSSNLPYARRPSTKKRTLRLESLEHRYMLSHPAVAAVTVASGSWTPSFVSYLQSSGLGTGGYAIPVGSTQLQTLPWNNIDTIRIKFNQDVVVSAADLSLSGASQNVYAFSGFGYDTVTYEATWLLTAPMAKDKLALDLDANGLAPVRSVATGEVLDGAWTDCQSTFPSGNTQGGTDFHFQFTVLPADVNGSNTVNGTDVIQINQRYNKVIGDAQYGVRYDANGDGVISATDYNFARSQVGALLPSGAPAGATCDAPTTGGIPDLSIAKGTVDHVFALTDFFEASTPNLSFSVLQNSNPSLVSGLSIDSGTLELTFANNMTGDANITIRATDGNGLIVDAMLKTHVSAAPVITDFTCINEIGDFWTLTGSVTDSDDPVAGDIVRFGGVFASFNVTATVGQDGVFSVTFEFVGLQSGGCSAQVTDPHGVTSEMALWWILA